MKLCGLCGISISPREDYPSGNMKKVLYEWNDPEIRLAVEDCSFKSYPGIDRRQ